MNFKTSKPVSFGSIIKLNRYEKWLQSSVKDILHDNKSFAKVDMKARVEDWNGVVESAVSKYMGEDNLEVLEIYNTLKNFFKI